MMWYILITNSPYIAMVDLPVDHPNTINDLPQ